MGLCHSCFSPARTPRPDQAPDAAKQEAGNLAGVSAIAGGGAGAVASPDERRGSASGVPGLNTGAAIKVAEKEMGAGGAAAAAAAAAAGRGGDAASAAQQQGVPGSAVVGLQASAGVIGGKGDGKAPPLAEWNAGGSNASGLKSGFEAGSAAVMGNGEQPHAPPNNSDDANLVRDGDGRCAPGVSVVVSQGWLAVPYFAQFSGLTGKLTRRGVSGVTWYAEFPGLFEQAFSTGMHGQHVLAYAPADAKPQGEQKQNAPPMAQLPPLEAIPFKKPSVPPPSASKQQAQALNQAAQQPPPRTAHEVPGLGSSRKDRLPSARSRAMMGAPPLHSSSGSAVSARGGKKPLDLQVSATPRDGELTSRESRKGRLFKYPEWEEYELFDSDDLWSEYAYLLYGEPDRGGNHVYVWVGQYMEEVESKDEASCKEFSSKAVSQFKAAMGGWSVGPVTIVRELKEPEVFWEYFAWG